MEMENNEKKRHDTLLKVSKVIDKSVLYFADIVGILEAIKYRIISEKIMEGILERERLIEEEREKLKK